MNVNRFIGSDESVQLLTQLCDLEHHGRGDRIVKQGDPRNTVGIEIPILSSRG